MEYKIKAFQSGVSSKKRKGMTKSVGTLAGTAGSQNILNSCRIFFSSVYKSNLKIRGITPMIFRCLYRLKSLGTWLIDTATSTSTRIILPALHCISYTIHDIQCRRRIPWDLPKVYPAPERFVQDLILLKSRHFVNLHGIKFWHFAKSARYQVEISANEASA